MARSAPHGFRFLETPLVQLARRATPADGSLWNTERQTGEGPLVAFTHAPLRVRFAGVGRTVLTSATVATPASEHVFTSWPGSDRGEDTTFIRLRGDALARLCAEHDPGALDRPDAPVPWCVSPADPAAAAAALRLSDAVFARGEPADRVWLEETLLGIVSRSVDAAFGARARRPRARPKPDPVGAEAVRRVCERIARSYAEPLGVGPLAALAGYTPGHFCRMFRHETGTTIHAYLTLVRVMAAVERLPERRGQVARLAQETGFASHAHLTSVFRRVIGETPSRVRDDHAAWIRERIAVRLGAARPESRGRAGARGRPPRAARGVARRTGA